MEDNVLDELVLEQDTNKTQDRIRNLSSKVKSTAEERDQAKAAAEAAEAARIAAEKERDFYASFSDQTSKYASASEHKDEIKEKVLAGYSVEDATVAVLNKAGKLVPQAAPVAPPAPAAGGSAPTILPEGGNKPLADMSKEERKEELLKAIERGDISLS